MNIQGNKYGGSFAVNLAIHFATAPDLLGNSSDPAKMTEAHCEFRRRLAEGANDMWWSHESSSESILEAVAAASRMYASVGRGYLNAAIDTLDNITPERLSGGDYDLHGFQIGRPRLGFVLARIRRIQGNIDDSKKFANFALQNLRVDVAWRSELEGLANL